MPAGRTNASALLQKVNSQLRGERVPLKTKEEDELATYLTSLNKKAQLVRSLDESGDISLSSGIDGVRGQGAAAGSSAIKVSSFGSKFLKKKKPVEEEQSEDDDKDGRQGIVIAGGRRDELSPKLKKKLSPLEKANALENKIKGRSAHRQQVSVESDSEDSLRGSEKGIRPGSADTSVGRDGPKFLKNRQKSADDDGRGSLRSPSPHMFQRSSSKDRKKKKKKKEAEDKTKGEIVRTLGHVYLTSEEESLAEFIHGLSVSESSVKRPQNLVAKKQQKWRKKSPASANKLVRSTSSPVNARSRSPSPFKRSPSPFGHPLSRSLSQDSDNMLDSMASEIVEDKHAKRQRSRQESKGSEDSFKLNLMDVATLIPSSPRRNTGNKKSSASKNKKGPTRSASASSFKAKEKNTKGQKERSKLKKSDSKSSLFESLGIHMVDELLGDGPIRDSGGDSDSEIKTEASDDGRRIRGGLSESEIITEIGAANVKKATKKTNATPFRAIVAQSVSELIGSGSHHVSTKQVASEPEDTDVGDDYSESFASESKTVTSSMSIKPRRERSLSPEDASYSKSSDRSRKRRGRRERKIVMEEKQVNMSTTDQHGGLHHWNTTQMDVRISHPYGLGYVDPAPVATKVISADALEAITAYSPNVLALQDMMRAQLDLVKNFVDIQNRIYQSCLDGLSYDHKYTTLEDTKEYIRQHRKPRMTFKEALKLVEQEEGIVSPA